MEFRDDGRDLAAVEVPGDGPGDQASQHGSERVDAPTAKVLPALLAQFESVERGVDAGERQGAHGCAEQKPIEPAPARQLEIKGQPGPYPSHDAAREIRVSRICGFEPAKKRRRRICAFDDGAR